MRNRKILGVDLGSAYTKLAIRRDWDDESQLLHVPSLASNDATFCIPSVVARVHRGSGERWLVGRDASVQLRGPGVDLYENWKAGLLGSSWMVKGEQCRAVAVQFFRGLRDHLGHTTPNVLDLPIRLCVPRLTTPRAHAGQQLQKLMLEVLREAEWPIAERRRTVYEPEANAVGVLTGGKNVTWLPRYIDFQPGGRSVRLDKMLDNKLLAAFRDWEKGATYGALVVDIGAFTTDFGYVVFDARQWSDEWNKPRIIQESVELGVQDLDNRVKKALTPDCRAAVASASVAEWDQQKAELYSGRPVAFRRPRGRVVVGQGAEGERITREVNGFAERVVKATWNFLGRHSTKQVHAAILTGGGALIPGVRRALEKALGAAGVRLPAGFEARAGQLRSLVRGGSAIGACSVFFEED